MQTNFSTQLRGGKQFQHLPLNITLVQFENFRVTYDFIISGKKSFSFSALTFIPTKALSQLQLSVSVCILISYSLPAIGRGIAAITEIIPIL